MPTLSISNQLVLPICISLLIFAFAMGLYLRWALEIQRATEAIAKIAKALQQTDLNGLDAIRYVNIKSQDKNLIALMNETKRGLVEIEGDLGCEFYSLKSHSETWTVRRVLSGRINLPLFETMPNILIGAGLMFTFIFLAMALADAGMAMDDKAERDKAMKSLIANAGGKFITSIVGLFCSLVWNFRAKVKIEALQEALQELQGQLQRLLPDTAAQAIVNRQHFIAKEILEESRAQVGQLKRFETDIAVALAKAIGNELAPAFKSLGEDLTKAIKDLAEKIGAMNQTALEDMIEDFMEKLGGATKTEMTELKSVLEKLAENLKNAGEGFTNGVGGAVESLGASVQAFENAVTTIKQSIELLDESVLRAEEAFSDGTDGFDAVTDKLQTNVEAVNNTLTGVGNFIEKIQASIETLDEVGQSLEKTAESQASIATQFSDAVPIMAEALSDAVTSISDGASQAAEALSTIEAELTKTKNSLGETVTALSTGVDQYTEKVKTLHVVLDVKVGEAISKIGSAVMDLNETMDDFLEALPKK